MEKVEHQQGLLQTLGGDGADFRIGKQVDQRLDVEAAKHGGEQFGGELARDEGVFLMARSHGVEEAGLEASRVVDARRHAMGQQIDEKRLLALGRIAQQGDQPLGLLGRQRQRRNSESAAFGDMGAVGVKHRHE